MFVPTQGRRARHEHLPGNKSIGRRPSWKAKQKRCSSADQIFPKDIYARKVMIEELKKHVLDHL